MKNIIVAYDNNRLIGANNDIPWRGTLPADMVHFKAITMGHVVIMGRKTYESIGRPLPGRENIVLSRQTNLQIPGCTVVSNIEQAFEVTEHQDSTFVIGGEKIYRLAMPFADGLYITEIEASFEGDSYFLEISPEKWQLVHQESHEPDADNHFQYTFLQYTRRHKA